MIALLLEARQRGFVIIKNPIIKKIIGLTHHPLTKNKEVEALYITIHHALSLQ